MSKEHLAFIVGIVALVLQPFFLTYFLLYNTYTASLIVLSARQVRRRVAGHFIEDLDLIDNHDSTKPITMVVPAYNEEVTIVDSVTNLIHVDYPRFEVVVVNDGSADRTLEVLKQAFRLRRTDLAYRDAIGTARVRATYEATIPLPKTVTKVMVIDKVNAGKADALNAGINASTSPYFVSLDADSILDQRALKELMRVIQEDPRVVAVGGQVAIANGCAIRNGRVVSVGLPSNPLARFQMVEYLRSFTTGRTGLDKLDSVLILSGVFAVFEKETVIRAGGYLTPFVTHRIVEDYIGPERFARTWRSSCGSIGSFATRCGTSGWRFSPTRWRGPKCPSGLTRSGNSGAAGIAVSGNRCCITGTCCSGGSTAESAGLPCRRSGSSSTGVR
jgi:cellulose synthase/poly-beta-1,6-N-acetylglucosamine synthase-like glycosyltransferase